jgi:hypothetical protein
MGILLDAMVSLIDLVLCDAGFAGAKRVIRRIAYGIAPCTCEERAQQRQGIRGIIAQAGIRIEH